MKGMEKGSWQYALLLVILFSTAALAVHSTLQYLTQELELGNKELALSATTYAVWAITMGFMMIAAAFGLWAIRFSAVAEARLRLIQLVEALDNIEDGVCLVDANARVITANTPTREFTSVQPNFPYPLKDLFEELDSSQVKAIAQRDTALEFEFEAGSKTLRLRAQPAGALSLLTISDVTKLHHQQARNRQAARFQLIGQLAKEVATDFNNILCAISGHAALLAHLKKDTTEITDSLDAIQTSVDKGIALAGHMMVLGESGAVQTMPDHQTNQHLEIGVTRLRADLPPDWRVQLNASAGLPGSPLGGEQLEQLVYHVGMHIADFASRPADLRLSVHQPGDLPLTDVPAEFAIVILVSLHNAPAPTEYEASAESGPPGGVLMALIESLVHGAGGRVDYILDFPESLHPGVRICLPIGTTLDSQGDDNLPPELKSYLSRWRVLAAAGEPEKYASLTSIWSDIGVDFVFVDSVITSLTKVQEDAPYDAILIEQELFGDDADALLKAIVKLCPGSGLTVLTRKDHEATIRSSDFVTVDESAPPTAICSALIEARSIAAHRTAKN